VTSTKGEGEPSEEEKGRGREGGEGPEVTDLLFFIFIFLNELGAPEVSVSATRFCPY
jgi:hypothetical protein